MGVSKFLDSILAPFEEKTELASRVRYGVEDQISSGAAIPNLLSMQTMTEEEALKLFPIAVGIDILGKALSGTEFKVENRNGDDITEDSNVGNMLNKPHSFITQIVLRTSINKDAYIRGNGYGYIDGDRMYYLDNVGKTAISNGEYHFSRAYIPGVSTGNKDGHVKHEAWNIPIEKVFHVRLNSYNGVFGRPITEKYNTLYREFEAVQNYHIGFFANGGRPSMALESDSEVVTNSMLEDVSNLITRRLMSNPGGIVAVPKGFHLRSVGVDPEAAQSSNLRVDLISNILATMGITPMYVGNLQKTSFANATQMRVITISEAIIPMLEAWKASAELLLLPGQKLTYDASKAIRGSDKELADTLKVATGLPFMTVNEAREIYGLAGEMDNA